MSSENIDEERMGGGGTGERGKDTGERTGQRIGEVRMERTDRRRTGGERREAPQSPVSVLSNPYLPLNDLYCLTPTCSLMTCTV